jgi:predicted permease
VETKNYISYSLKINPASTGLSDLRETYEDPLWLLMAIASVVLLIACANLANLLLARATARQREVAVRLAIGASRMRLVRQFLAESLLLALFGAVCGALLAGMLSRTLVGFLTTTQDSVFLDLHMNVTVLAFAAGLAVFTCVLFGLAPALRATQTAPAAAMKAGGRGITSGRERFTLQRILVSAQVALSLVLLFSALLFVRTFRNLSTLNAGFRTDGILVVNVDLQRAGYPDSRMLEVGRELLEHLQATPGVDGAAQAENFPMSGDWSNDNVQTESSRDDQSSRKISYFTQASPGLFKVLGIPILAGRDLNDSDTVTSPKVALVNEAFSRKVFGGGNPVGRRFFVRMNGATHENAAYEIVGLVGNTKIETLRENFKAMAFVPVSQRIVPSAPGTFVVHSSLPIRDIALSVLRSVNEVNPAISVNLSVFKRQIAETLVPESLMATLSSFFGLLAALLATIGLYGVVSYMVGQRTNEIGIRIALGANRGRIMSMVLQNAGALILTGLAAGAVLALLGARAANTLLFQLRPYDPLTLIASIAFLAGVSLFAATVPARRAARLEPMSALREE